MPSIREQSGRYEIRECRTTARGPRQVTLAHFRGVLTPEVLDEAQARAQRPFERRVLRARARAKGIPVSSRRRGETARRLLAELGLGRPLDPVLVGLLRSALGAMESQPLPEHLADAADWLGRSEAERGKALRGLLRTASRVVQSRGQRPAAPEPPFPRFCSEPQAA